MYERESVVLAPNHIDIIIGAVVKRKSIFRLNIVEHSKVYIPLYTAFCRIWYVKRLDIDGSFALFLIIKAISYVIYDIIDGLSFIKLRCLLRIFINNVD